MRAVPPAPRSRLPAVALGLTAVLLAGVTYRMLRKSAAPKAPSEVQLVEPTNVGEDSVEQAAIPAGSPVVVVRIDPKDVRSRVCVGSSCVIVQGSCVLPAKAAETTEVAVTAPGYRAYTTTLTLAQDERLELVLKEA
jgi:hypothetical protein